VGGGLLHAGQGLNLAQHLSIFTFWFCFTSSYSEIRRAMSSPSLEIKKAFMFSVRFGCVCGGGDSLVLWFSLVLSVHFYNIKGDNSLSRLQSESV